MSVLEIIDGTMVLVQKILEFGHSAYCRAVGDYGISQMPIQNPALNFINK